MRAFQFAIVLLMVAVWFIHLAPGAPPERVILDTDSGPFNDDGAALVMVAADWLGRTLLFPAQLPAGLLASLLGGAYFMLCLYRR